MVDLTKLTLEEVSALRRECDQHLSTWFGFTTAAQARQTPEFVAATTWRLDGKTEPCCECGETYPAADRHFGGEIFCPAHRGR